MEPFKAIQEPDEGYSEHPLYPSGASGNAPSTALTGVQSPADLPAWLSTQLPSLSVQQKTRELIPPCLCMPCMPCISCMLYRALLCPALPFFALLFFALPSLPFLPSCYWCPSYHPGIPFPFKRWPRFCLLTCCSILSSSPTPQS